MTTRSKSQNGTSNASSKLDVKHFSSAVDASASAIMMVDRNLDITFMNGAAQALFDENVDAFREQYSAFDPHALLGANIEKFHADASRIRAILTDARRLPHVAKMRVGELYLRIAVAPIFDASGEHVGCALEWTDESKLIRERERRTHYERHLSALNRSLAIATFDMDGRFIEANETFVRTIGYTASELEGRKLQSLFASTESRTKHDDKWQEIALGQSFSELCPLMRKDDHQMWLEGTFSPVLDDAGKPSKVVFYGSDATERQAEHVELKGIFEAVNRTQATISFSMDGTILDANAHFLRMMGYTLSEIKGRHHSIFVEPAYKSSAEYHEMWRRLREGRFDTGEYPRVTKSGETVWITASYNPILDAEGTPIGVRKFVAVQSQAGGDAQASLYYDMDGGIVRATESALDLLGYEGEDLSGRSSTIVAFDAQSEPLNRPELWAALRRGEVVARECRRRHRNGSGIWVQSTFSALLDIAGRPRKVVEHMTDITEQVKLKKELEAAISETIRVSGRLAVGDLTDRMEGEFEGRFADLQKAINGFIGKTVETLRQAKGSAEAVAQATSELRAASEHLADGASKQRTACQVSAQALEQTSLMVASTAEGAKRANELVGATAQNAEEGAAKMATLTAAMNDIASSSQEIAKIIKVIDEIAFQTNLLAVNAAVEAARAGKHGRGFAVVAQEVRSLAERSAKAAQSTSLLIEGAGETVSRGVENVEQTASSLEAIREDVKRVQGLVREISAAGDEQSKGVGEITHAMNEINLSAQSAQEQSAQLTEAAKDLARLSDGLRSSVRTFELPTETPTAVTLSPDVLRQLAAALGANEEALAKLVAANTPTPPADEHGEHYAGEGDNRGFGTF